MLYESGVWLYSTVYFPVKVLPHLVERKTWDDLDDSLESNRFQSQVNKMKVSEPFVGWIGQSCEGTNKFIY